MDKLRTWWQAHRPTTRRLAQLYCALLYNANLKGFLKGNIYTGYLKHVCVPGLNCYSCPGAVGACPLGALQNALTSSGTRAGTYVFGIVLLFGICLGRTICGWFCPMGLLQEMLHRIPTPKIRKSRVTRALSCLKYFILAIFVLAIPLWYGIRHNLPLPAFCKYLCPAGTLEGAIALLSHPDNSGLFSMLGLLFTRKFVILTVICLACIFCYRAFCRFLCPLGAIYGLFHRVSILGVRINPEKCTNCGTCIRSCPMDVRKVSDTECIHCGRCMNVCHEKAISLKAGRIVLHGPDLSSTVSHPSQAHKKERTRGRIIWAAALSLLLCVFVLVHLPRTSNDSSSAALLLIPEEASTPSDETVAPPMIGFEVGQQLHDFTIRTLSGQDFVLSENLGHVTFINLWATYCTPCVQELPYFSLLKDSHPDITVLAVHSSMVTEDVEAYLENRDWHLDFCIDTQDDLIFRLVGGSPLLPQTIVLNTRGEVIYNQAGSVTFEKLEALLQEGR